MRVPDKNTRIAITNLLSAGLPKPVRDTVALPDDGFPNIVIAGFNSFQDGSKSQFMFTVNFTLRITDRREKVGNSNDIDDIANTAMMILAPTPAGPYPIVDNFEIWNIDLEGTQTNNYTRLGYNYIEKNLSITLKLEQL